MKKILGRAFAALLCVTLLAAGSLTVSAKTFPDVKENQWFYDVVDYMSDNGIVNGRDTGLFDPDANVTRAEFVKMLTDAFGYTKEVAISYDDVKSNQWFYKYYSRAASAGFVDEVFDTKKQLPDAQLKREEAAALVMACLQYPTDDKASASSFSDFDEITNTKFENYVLKAAAAGVVKGDSSTSSVTTFRPLDTLKRSEAAQIIANGLGTIANKDGVNIATFKNAGKNVVVTKACTVENLTIEGNLIISSGVTGAVTIDGCTVKGFVSNLSDAAVSINDCDIEGFVASSGGKMSFLSTDVEKYISVLSKGEVSVSGGSVDTINVDVPSATIKLTNGAEIDTLNVENASASISFSGDAVVDKLNVKSGASSTKITGTKGKINDADINANSFSSEFLPEDYTLGSGVSSITIGGKKYADGIIGDIEVKLVSNKPTVTVETYLDATIKWYFSDKSTKPSSESAFNSAYSSADIKDTENVTKFEKETIAVEEDLGDDDKYFFAGVFVDGKLKGDVKSIDCSELKHGFKSNPTIALNSSKTKDKITATAIASGKLYYYYTADATVPASYEAADDIYDDTDSAVKGSFAVGTTSKSGETVDVGILVGYTHCVAFFVDDSDNGYDPVIMKRPETPSASTESGLSNEPFVLMAESNKTGKDILVVTPTVGGTLKWFYTTGTQDHSTKSFDREYSNIEKVYKDVKNCKLYGSATVKKNEKSEIELATLTECDEFAPNNRKSVRVVIKIGNNDPIRVDRRTHETGFEVIPVVVKTDKTDIFSYKTIGDTNDTIKYVYVSSSKALTVEEFKKLYDVADEDYKGEIKLTSTYAKEYTGISESDPLKDSDDISSYGYVAFMYCDYDYKEHKPVISVRRTIGTNFEGKPTVIHDVDADGGYTYVSFKAYSATDIDCFMVASNFSEASINDMFEYSTVTPHPIKKENVKVGSNVIAIPESDLSVLKANGEYYTYFVLRAKYDAHTPYDPVIVPIKVIDDGVKMEDPAPDKTPVSEAEKGKILENIPSIVFEYKNGRDYVGITLNKSINGTLYYGYTSSVPTDATCKSLLNSADYKGTVLLSGQYPKFETIRFDDIYEDCGYFVYQIVDSDGKEYTPGFKEIEKAHRAQASISSVGISTKWDGFIIRTQPGVTGKFKVKWVYSTTEIKNLTIDEFSKVYNSAEAKAKGVTKEAIEFVKNEGEENTVLTNFSQAEVGSTQYKYLYAVLIAITDNNKEGKTYFPMEFDEVKGRKASSQG